MNKKKALWLIKQLPLLKEKNIIDATTADKIKNYYESNLKSDNNIKLILIISSVFASLLITGGIILLIAYNWSYIPKFIKTITAFLILFTAQAGAFTVIYKNMHNSFFKEAVVSALSILFGAVVAFVAQIYQLPANEETFIIVWGLSTLVLLYIYNSYTAFLLFLILSLILSYIMPIYGTKGILFIPLLFITVPFYYINFQNKVKNLIIEHSAYFISIIVATIFILLDKPFILWALTFLALFTIFYLIYEISSNFTDQVKSLQLFSIISVIINCFLIYIFTFLDVWEIIITKEEYLLHSGYFIFLFALYIMLLIISFVYKIKINYFFSFYLTFILTLIAIANINFINVYVEGFYLIFSAFLVNIMAILYGAHSFYLSYKESNLRAINGATIFVFAVFISRFFDLEISVIIKAIFFIVLGVSIAVLNIFLSKKFKNEINNKNEG